MSAAVVKHDGGDELIEIPGHGIVVAAGTELPANGAIGYSKGCLFIQVDGGSTNALLYSNSGTQASATFIPHAPATQGAALTAQLTTITHTAPGAADYDLQDLVQNTGFGFATANEGNTTLAVIANLQARLAEVEARLEAANIIASN